MPCKVIGTKEYINILNDDGDSGGGDAAKEGIMLLCEQLKRLGRCQDNRFSKQTQFFFHFLTVGVSRSVPKEIVAPWEETNLNVATQKR